jgi:hypothetical protein
MPNDNKITTIELLILAKIFFLIKLCNSLLEKNKCLKSHLKPKKVTDLYLVGHRIRAREKSRLLIN